ncbi:MAG TPA: hypothetical protein VH682_09540 [Gemmataceae bacterium]|jgi:hypothetical protein
MVDALGCLPLELLKGLIPSSRLLEIGKHPGLQSLADHGLVPLPEVALGLLGKALAGDSRYHVGHSCTFLNDDAQGHSDLNSFLLVFDGAQDDVMAVRPLAAAAERVAGQSPLSEAVRQMHLARNLAAQEEVAAQRLTPGFQAPPPRRRSGGSRPAPLSRPRCVNRPRNWPS